MKNDRIVISALLCAMFLANAGISRAEDITDFESLKKAIENPGEDPVNWTDIQSAVTFTDKLEINKTVTLSGKTAGDSSSSLSPFVPDTGDLVQRKQSEQKVKQNQSSHIQEMLLLSRKMVI